MRKKAEKTRHTAIITFTFYEPVTEHAARLEIDSCLPFIEECGNIKKTTLIGLRKSNKRKTK